MLYLNELSMLKGLFYLFALLHVLLYLNIDANTNIQFLSFLTLQSSASLSRGLVGLAGFTLEDKYRLCLDELSTARSALTQATEKYETCMETLTHLEDEYSGKWNLCGSLMADYEQYCKDEYKPKVFGNEYCEQLKEQIDKCLNERRELADKVKEQNKKCEKLAKDIKDTTKEYEKIERKCSKMESSIFRERTHEQINVLEDEDVMDKPLCAIKRGDQRMLALIVEGTQMDLKRCRSELTELNNRLHHKNYQIDEQRKKISQTEGAKSGIKGVFKSSDEGESSKSSDLKVELSTLKSEAGGLKKLILAQQKKCKHLETKLEKAIQRHTLAKSLPTTTSETRGTAGCFGRFTGLISRTCRRVANRFTRNNGNRRNRARRREGEVSETQF
ncbi:uncharacterized protein cubi_00382 [Cryptosporidium ubiquitum]|uniref:Uncharacterized protein n=1 Tax=Cryptosporidium ubiquitum TaxID=857276 RepID=A0A1J4MG10_9CRYT|nr:uncharacterized protein cubi_00382 [Cryptosporidium ubiquitum]OII72387.1 hypothetical protein cubi_00382 [Cryptosporidium ubiquitum]